MSIAVIVPGATGSEVLAQNPIKIEREEPDKIHVGAGGTLSIPREDIGTDFDVGQDLDLAALQAMKNRKPNRREFFMLNPESELTTRLLLHKPKLDGMDVDHYYVSPDLRAPIVSELKAVRVFQFFSLSTMSHALWIVNVTPENDWYESLNALFKQSAEFFKNNAVRVISDKQRGAYRVKFKPTTIAVNWPAKPTAELLGEALGADRFITSADHPIYADLVAGSEL